jgi:cytochrome c5
MKRIILITCLLVPVCPLVCSSSAESAAAKKDASAVPVVQPSNAEAMRVQGEQRFRANCGRCHAAPQKFPPRMMGTVLRHMRVRALISAEDARLVLFYMTQ